MSSQKIGKPEPQAFISKRNRTCKCGTIFVAERPSRTYCSVACRKYFTRYGQTHGTTVKSEDIILRSGYETII